MTDLAIDRTLGVTAAAGFQAGAATGGIKPSGASDMAVLAAREAVPTAAVFTTNRVTGAPVQVSRLHLADRRTMRAWVVSSGNSNVCTGAKGLADAKEMTAMVAEDLACDVEAVLVASTGVIGRPLPMDQVRAGVRAACGAMAAGPDADAAFAEAIMTTDTRPKRAGVRLALSGTTVTLAGATKGVGMIAPNMATTLSFLTTDAAVEPALLQAMLERVVARTYNALTIDGHESTSDTMSVMASGAAGVEVNEDTPEAEAFEAALLAVCGDLAYQIVDDAEGGTKVIEVRVTGAATADDARRAARAIATSPLVKCAFFGKDPNWGRVTSAAGMAGIASGPETMSLRFGDVLVYEAGTPTAADPAALKRIMAAHDVLCHLDLGAGDGEARVLTCDLSYDYIKINAEYTT